MALRTLNEQVADLLAIGLENRMEERHKPNKAFNPKPRCPDQLPSRALMLKTYNKYRKGYEYTKEVWELRELVLPLAVSVYVNSVNFKRLYNYMTYKEHYDDDYKFWERRENKFLDGCNGLVTGSFRILVTIKHAIERLAKAKTDFDVLCAVDCVFNIMHDDGAIGKHMVTINGKEWNEYSYTTWHAKFEEFRKTLNTLRDW